jgi:hypothetical protein
MVAAKEDNHSSKGFGLFLELRREIEYRLSYSSRSWCSSSCDAQQVLE